MASPSRLPSHRPAAATGGRSRPMSMFEPNFAGLELPPTDKAVLSKQSKRRSLLPQLSRSSSAEYREPVAEAGVASAVNPVAGEEKAVVRQADTKAMPPPSKLSRPSSIRAPPAGGLSRTQSVRTHARNASKDGTGAATRPGPTPTSSVPASNVASRLSAVEPGLKRSSSTRLPQSPKPGTTTGLDRTHSIRTAQAHSRSSSTSTSTSTLAEKRSSTTTTSARPLSLNTSATTLAPILRSPTSPGKPLSGLQPNARTQMLPPSSKPGFTTYQQHYSPAKSALPKPPVPAVRQPKPPQPSEDDVPMTFELARQQIELMQLSLLHQSAREVAKGYEESARRKLGRRHAKLKKEYEIIRAAELEDQRLANLEALEKWCSDGAVLNDGLHVLSRVYDEVCALAEPGSRYAAVVADFEAWVPEAEGWATAVPRQGRFIEPLPQDCRQAQASLALKLRSLQRDMDPLPPMPICEDADAKPSSLGLLMRSCTTLIDGMLRELEFMGRLEKLILERERVRIDEEVQAVMLDNDVTDLEGVKGVDWAPLWQKVG